MSSLLIGLFFGLGSGAWIFAKMQHRNGGNTKNSLVVAGIVGALGLVVIWMIFNMLLKKH